MREENVYELNFAEKRRDGRRFDRGYLLHRQYLRDKYEEKMLDIEGIMLKREIALNIADHFVELGLAERVVDRTHEHSVVAEQLRLRTRKLPTEVVTTNTVPLPTDDVDELVSLIEGTGLSKKTTESKTNKLAKKARQKEKKRQEEEGLRRIQEERERAIEAELEAERAEAARKKREKKKRSKQKKKGGWIENGGCGIYDETTKEPKLEPSEMVTIRRHASAPETTVTISLRNQSGPEKVLFTLVNGQVVGSDVGGFVRNSVDDYENTWFGGGVYEGPGLDFVPQPPTTSFNTQSIDFNNLKLPPGITITKINKEKSDSEEVSEDDSHSQDQDDSDQLDQLQYGSSQIPKSGAGIYDIDSNRIFMNPVSSEEEEESYEHFQPVLGKKKSRKPQKTGQVDSSATKKKEKKIRKDRDCVGKKVMKKKPKGEMCKTVLEPLRSPESFPALQHPPPSITPNDPVKMTQIVAGNGNMRQRAASGPTISQEPIIRDEDNSEVGSDYYNLWNLDFMSASRPGTSGCKSKDEDPCKSNDSLNGWDSEYYPGLSSSRPNPYYSGTTYPTNYDPFKTQRQGYPHSQFNPHSGLQEFPPGNYHPYL